MWRKALPVLEGLRPQQVLLAFDADWRTNPHVAQALGQAALALVRAGYEVQVEDWDPTSAKGLTICSPLGTARCSNHQL